MNVNRLAEILGYLQGYEDTYKIQPLLLEIHGHLNNIASVPGEQSYQLQYMQSLEKLQKSLGSLEAQLEPREVTILEEIGGLEFYSSQLVGEIKHWVAENPASTSIAASNVAKLAQRRSDFVTHINGVQSGFEKFGLDEESLKPGETEIGFLLPRSLFENELPILIKELNTINNILRSFSEVALGSVEEVKVRDISTTDPIFFFELSPITIAMIGAAITWALDTWKRVEDIRKIRVETAKLSDTKSRPELDNLLAKMVDENIDKAIKEHTTILLSEIKAERSRKNELSNQMDWALRSILSRIERGMVVEIRRLSPPTEKDEQGTAKPPPQAFQDIAKIVPDMVFPRVKGTPVLSLPPAEPPMAAERKSADKGQRTADKAES